MRSTLVAGLCWILSSPVTFAGEPPVPQVALQIVPVGGSGVSDGETKRVEVFVTALANVSISGVQVSLPCPTIPAPVQSGVIEFSDAWIDFSGSSGGVPYLFNSNAVVGVSPECESNNGYRAAMAAGVGQPFASLSNGQTRYLATYEYLARCPTGSIAVNFVDPEPGGTSTAVRNASFSPIAFSAMGTLLSSPGWCDEIKDDILRPGQPANCHQQLWFQVPSRGVVRDVDVEIRQVSMDFHLLGMGINHLGTYVQLHDNSPVDSSPAGDLIFDDEAETSIDEATTANAGLIPEGSYRPDAPLSAFDAMDGTGTWGVFIDQIAGTCPTVYSVILHLTTDADDGSAYTCVKCVLGACQLVQTTLGDVNCDGNPAPNLDDILCVLGGFSGPAHCPNADIHPSCVGNNVINLDDILVVLRAFGGDQRCD